MKAIRIQLRKDSAGVGVGMRAFSKDAGWELGLEECFNLN